MLLFRIFLASAMIVIIGYTSLTIAHHGMDLLPIFFGDIAKGAWPGQFNVDFSAFLLLSGLWVSWRHQFSFGGVMLGLVAVFGGMLFLTLYLLVASFKTDGEVKALLLGAARARQG